MRERLDTLVHWFEQTVNVGGWLTEVDLELDEASLAADLNYGRDDEARLEEPTSPTLH